MIHAVNFTRTRHARLSVVKAVIVGIYLAVFAPAKLYNLATSVNADQNPFSHLSDISRFSKFIRYIIVDRFMTRQININLLTATDPLTSNTLASCRQTAVYFHNLDISAVQDYVIKVNGIRVNANSLRLRLFIKNGKEATKSFPCHFLGTEDPEALSEIQHYLI